MNDWNLSTAIIRLVRWRWRKSWRGGEQHWPQSSAGAQNTSHFACSSIARLLTVKNSWASRVMSTSQVTREEKNVFLGHEKMRKTFQGEGLTSFRLGMPLQCDLFSYRWAMFGLCPIHQAFVSGEWWNFSRWLVRIHSENTTTDKMLQRDNFWSEWIAPSWHKQPQIGQFRLE